MNGAVQIAAAVAACAFGGVACALAAYARGQRRARARRRQAALAAQGVRAGNGEDGSGDVQGAVLRYADGLTRRLFSGATSPLCPSVRAERAEKTRAGKHYLEQARSAGCAKRVSVAAYCEARVRLAAAGAAAGALLGAFVTPELAVALCLAGAVLGSMLLPRAVRSLRRQRAACAERHLSEMLEVVSLGLRSGLTFDRSFALYGSHFDNDFARECARVCRTWTLGLSTREDALRDLAGSFDCAQLSRIVDTVLRSLRFGTGMAGSLEEAAASAREAYRTALGERVAKAPVKMMLPTGTLILPAMLLLVMGPILLELAGGF